MEGQVGAPARREDLCPPAGAKAGRGGFWRRAPLSHLAHPPMFLETGGLPLHLPAEHRTPCTLLGGWGRFLAFPRVRGAGRESFSRPQPHSLIVCDSLIVCAPAFSSPVGVEPLQRRYEALQVVTKLLRVVTEPLRVVTSRYGAVTNLTSRYGVGRLKMSLCLTAAFAPVPAFLGRSCPLGCSLSAPATGGFSVFSLQCNMYAAGS